MDGARNLPTEVGRTHGSQGILKAETFQTMAFYHPMGASMIRRRIAPWPSIASLSLQLSSSIQGRFPALKTLFYTCLRNENMSFLFPLLLALLVSQIHSFPSVPRSFIVMEQLEKEVTVRPIPVSRIMVEN